MTTETLAPPAPGTGSKRLDGRVAIVTGGTRGIGAAISRALAADGATVAAGYTSNEDAAKRFVDALCSEVQGASLSMHRGNVGNCEDCTRVVDEVLEQHGRVDILVNNAGITNDMPVLKMSAEDWEKVINVNLNGAFYMTKPTLEHMVERGSGRIVNISSIIGQRGNIGQANYAASKSALFGFTQSVAREAAWALGKADKLGDPVGLTVNTVAPGYIATEMVAAVPEKVLDKIRAQIPLGRLGEAHEIARMVHFLCDDASSYITGQVFAVNGGMEM